MPTTGGPAELTRTHEGRVAQITLDHGRYNIVTFETRASVAAHFGPSCCFRGSSGGLLVG